MSTIIVLCHTEIVTMTSSDLRFDKTKYLIKAISLLPSHPHDTSYTAVEMTTGVAHAAVTIGSLRSIHELPVQYLRFVRHLTCRPSFGMSRLWNP